LNENLIERLKRKLPAHPGILGREDLSNTAVIVPLVFFDDDPYFLFQKRSETIRQGGEICFPGGRFDMRKDSDIRETAIRETSEELGIDRNAITIIGQLDTLVAHMGVTVDSYIAILSVEHHEELRINRSEVERIFYLPLSVFRNAPEEYSVLLSIQPSIIDELGNEKILFPAKELSLPDRYTRPWGHVRHSVYAYRTGEGAIWGITAAIIRAVMRYAEME
jgi:peroxisomal coenzyme A diphosphatase NUDT7